MNVLVDTSVWVQHFKYGIPQLVQLLERDLVMIHPMVLLELACGTPPKRVQTLSDLSLLSQCEQATFAEVANWIEKEQLYGLGCGLVDLCLLASTRLTPDTKIWTLDKRLQRLAERFGVRYWESIN